MAQKILHKRTVISGKTPTVTDLSFGEIAINYNDATPAMYIKTSGETEERIVTFKSSNGTENLVEITYDELKTLRDNKQLEKGTQYRITDYECTTSHDETQSAGHQFDIIVVADDEETLNENARAIQHEGDTYFENCNLEAWELKYSMDNNTDRFTWADNSDVTVSITIKEDSGELVEDGRSFTKSNLTVDDLHYASQIKQDYPGYIYVFKCSDDYNYYHYALSQTKLLSIDSSVVYCENNGDSTHLGKVESLINGKNGKGVIYHMVDEWNNECQYDFKNIQYAIRLTDGQYDSDGNSTYVYTFNAYNKDNLQILDLSVINNLNNGKICIRNKIESNYDFIGGEDRIRTLSNNVFLNTYSSEESDINCRDNILSIFTCCNIFGSSCNYNKIYNGIGNILKNECEYNEIYGSNNELNNYCSYNILNSGNLLGEESCENEIYGYSNNIGKNCYYNKIYGKNSEVNTLGDNCEHNTLGDNCKYNQIGDYCENNIIKDYSEHNTIGNNCKYNTFNNECKYNQLDSYCESNEFGNNCGIDSNGSSSTSTGNILGKYSYNNKFGIGCYANQLKNISSNPIKDNACHDNIFGNICYSNTFEFNCYSNIFGNSCFSNTFNSSCHRNDFANYCFANTFSSGCYNNIFDTECRYNVLGSNSHDNTFYSGCRYSSLGSNCYSNVLKYNCYNIRIDGTYCFYNIIGNNCMYISFRDSSTYKSYYQYITIDDGNQYLYLGTTQTTSEAQPLKNIHIVKGVNNTSNYITITIDTVNQSYETRVERNRDTGNIRIYNIEADKQDKLVSGENIKTINGESIVGEGNIDLNGLIEELTKSMIDSLFNDGTISKITNGTTTLSGTISNSTIATSNSIKYNTLS